MLQLITFALLASTMVNSKIQYCNNKNAFGGGQMNQNSHCSLFDASVPPVCIGVSTNLFITNPTEQQYTITYNGMTQWNTGIVGVSNYQNAGAGVDHLYCGVTAQSGQVVEGTGAPDQTGIYDLAFKLCNRVDVVCDATLRTAKSCEKCNLGNGEIDCQSTDCQWLDGICIDPKKIVVPVQSPRFVQDIQHIINTGVFCPDTLINFLEITGISTASQCQQKCFENPECVEYSHNPSGIGYCDLMNSFNCAYDTSFTHTVYRPVYTTIDLPDYELINGYRFQANNQYTIVQQQAYISKQIINSGQVKEDCAKLCIEEILCRHFNLDNTKACRLFGKYLSEYTSTQIEPGTFGSFDIIRLNHFTHKIPMLTCQLEYQIVHDSSQTYSTKTCKEFCEKNALCKVFKKTSGNSCRIYRNCLNPPNLMMSTNSWISSFIKRTENNLFYIDQHTWQQAFDNAGSKGSRLLTLEEGRLELARNLGLSSWDETYFSTSPANQVGALVPVQDTWIAVGETIATKDWMYIGTYNSVGNLYPGKSHVKDVGSYPTCADSPCVQLTIYTLIHSSRYQQTNSAPNIARYESVSENTFDCPEGSFINHIIFGASVYQGGALQSDFRGVIEVSISCQDPITLAEVTHSSLQGATGANVLTYPAQKLRNYFLCMQGLQHGKVTYKNVIDYKGIDYLRVAYCQYCTGTIITSADAATYSPTTFKLFIQDPASVIIESFTFKPVELQNPASGCQASMYCDILQTDCLTELVALVLPYELIKGWEPDWTVQYDHTSSFTLKFPINQLYEFESCIRCYSNSNTFFDTQIALKVKACDPALITDLAQLNILVKSGGLQITNIDLPKDSISKVALVIFEEYTVNFAKENCIDKEPQYSLVDQSIPGLLTYPAPICQNGQFCNKLYVDVGQINVLTFKIQIITEPFTSPIFKTEVITLTIKEPFQDNSKYVFPFMDEQEVPFGYQNNLSIYQFDQVVWSQDWSIVEYVEMTISELILDKTYQFNSDIIHNIVISADGSQWIKTSDTKYIGDDVIGAGGYVADVQACYDMCYITNLCFSVYYQILLKHCQPKSVNQNNVTSTLEVLNADTYERINQGKINRFSFDTSEARVITIHAYARKKGELEYGISPPILIKVGCDPNSISIDSSYQNKKIGYHLNSNNGKKLISVLPFFSLKNNDLCSQLSFSIQLVQNDIQPQKIQIIKDKIQVLTTSEFKQDIIISIYVGGSQFGLKALQINKINMKLKVYEDMNTERLSLNLFYDLQPYVIKVTQMYQWFGFNELTTSEYDDYFTSFQLYKNKQLTEQFSNGKINFDDQDNLAITRTFNLNRQIFYLKIRTLYGVDLVREIDVTVCGSEQVLVSEQIDLSYSYKTDTKIVIEPSEYTTIFEVSNSNCPIISYGLFEKVNNEMKRVIFSIGYLEFSSKEIHIQGHDLMKYQNYTLYLVATSTGNKTNEVPIFLTRIEQKNIIFNSSYEKKSENITNQIKVEEAVNETAKTNETEHPVTAKIKSVGVQGIVTIQFDQAMWDEKDGLNITSINQDVLDIYFSNKLINMTWQSISFKDDNLDIQLNISNPHEVSIFNTSDDEIYDERDTIFIDFKDRLMIKSNKGHPVTQELMSSSIRKQLKSDSYSQSLFSSGQGIMDQMNNQNTIAFFVNMILAIVLNNIITKFSSLQIIAFQSMLQLQYPSNVSFLTNTINFVLKIDYLDVDYLGQVFTGNSLSDWVEENQGYILDDTQNILIPNIIEQGFETYNPVFNLGGIMVIILLYMSQLIFLAIFLVLFQVLNCCKYRDYKDNMEKMNEQFEGGDKEKNMQTPKRQKIFYKCINRLIKKWKSNLFFNQFFLIVSESSLQLIMSGILFYYSQTMFQRREQNKDNVDDFTDFNNFVSVIGCLCLLFPFVLLLLDILILFRDEEWLLHRHRITTIGSLYYNLKMNSKFALSFNLNFFVRRVYLTMIFLFMQSYPAQQIQSILLINLSCFIHTGISRPFQRLRNNKIELVNEYVVCIIGLILISFSSFCPDPENQYSMGWIYICLLVFLTTFNLSFLIKDLVLFIKICWIKFYIYSNYYIYDRPKHLEYLKNLEIINELNRRKLNTLLLKNNGFIKMDILQNNKNYVPRSMICLKTGSSSNEVGTNLKQVMLDMFEENERKLTAQILIIYSKSRELLICKARNLVNDCGVSFTHLQNHQIELFDYEKSRIFNEHKVLKFLMFYFKSKFVKEVAIKTKVKKYQFQSQEIQDKIKEFLKIDQVDENREKNETELEWDHICQNFLTQSGHYKPSPQLLDKPKTHHLFKITYNLSEEALKNERKKFSLNDSEVEEDFGKQPQQWSKLQITSFSRMGKIQRVNTLKQLFLNEDEMEKYQILQKIQSLYIVISHKYDEQISELNYQKCVFHQKGIKTIKLDQNQSLQNLIMEEIKIVHNGQYQKIIKV